MNILPTIAQQATPADVARQNLSNLIQMSNMSIIQMCESAARSMALIWKPSGYTTTDAFDIIDTNAAQLFQHHAETVQYLWSNAARKASFVQACRNHGVSVSEVNGLPVFGDMLPIEFAQDGSVSLA